MEGVIDLIYRLDGRIWIADYKTDDVAAEDAPARADHYRSQAVSVFTCCRECFRIVVSLISVYLFAARHRH